MRKLSLIIGAAVLVAACAWADGPDTKLLTIVLGAGAGGTNASAAVSGYIEEVQVSAADGFSTGLVAVTMQPADAVVAAYNIATNLVVGSGRWRPVVDRTAVDASDLASDPPARYLVYGDTVKFIVTGSATNRTWNCRIKTNDR